MASNAKDAKNRPFTKDLKIMMFGFGDDPNPNLDSVEVLEEILIEYIQETARKSSRLSTRRQKLYAEDILFTIRKDRKKFNRGRELLKANEDIKNARRAFDETGNTNLGK